MALSIYGISIEWFCPTLSPFCARSASFRRSALFCDFQKGVIMERYHIIKDGQIIASTATKEAAIALIREYQKTETHYLLRSEYSYIKGEEVFVKYRKG